MQVTKSEIVSTAMGDQSRPGRLSVRELVRLFGTMTGEDEQREFILVDDVNDYDEGAPPVQAAEEEEARAEQDGKHPRRR